MKAEWIGARAKGHGAGSERGCTRGHQGVILHHAFLLKGHGIEGEGLWILTLELVALLALYKVTELPRMLLFGPIHCARKLSPWFPFLTELRIYVRSIQIYLAFSWIVLGNVLSFVVIVGVSEHCRNPSLLFSFVVFCPVWYTLNRQSL